MLTDEELNLRAAEARYDRLSTGFDTQALSAAGVLADLSAAQDRLALMYEDAVEGR